MTFAIPTEGDNDADAHTPEVAAGGHIQVGAVSPPPSFITDSQLGELQLLLDHLNVPVAEVLKIGKINSLADLGADRFEKVKQWINNRALELRGETA